MKSPGERLFNKISTVINDDNCSGCGVCAGLFAGVDMDLSQDGFMRPVMNPSLRDANDAEAPKVFDTVCPGRRVTAPSVEAGGRVHPVFGRYLGVWEGWSADTETRQAGSSGGVLTSIAAFVSEQTGRPAQMVAMDKDRPTRSVPVRIMSRDEALSAAGSRYAPVSVGVGVAKESSSLTGKPCEISGIRAAKIDSALDPLLLSFFCAGTPSQLATNQLIEGLDHNIESVTRTRYRGDGWPGKFVVTSADGRRSSRSYEESWGEVLGKQLQGRCKICVDGTGESADIAVGDYWETDAAGYPRFDDQEGRSVVIARTVRGMRALNECVASGVIELRSIQLDSVTKIQPLQVNRRLTLAGRLLGRRLTGQRVPSYRGYSLTPLLVRHFVPNMRAAAGTIRRSLRNSRNTK